MSWLTSHTESERFASDAHDAIRRGDMSSATSLFEQAAVAEYAAFQALGSDKPRTLGITAVSAVALWYKAGNLAEAEALAYRAAATKGMPAFALDELRTLLQAIWNQQAQLAAGVSFVPGQVVVSVKGGEVVSGGAPLDAIIDKVQIIQSLFFRTAEFVKNMPLRKKGPPSRELQQQYRPWLFQSVPGSYQFIVAVQRPTQEELFPTDEPEPEVLTGTFLSILRSVSEDPGESLNAIVPNREYREAFLKMTRNLAPTGKVVGQVEIRGAGDREVVVLSPGSRKIITDTLRSATPTASAGTESQEESILRGTLRALNLDQDWLEITIDGTPRRVAGVGETIDDLIGPMVNREVAVRVRTRRGGFDFVDIELEE